MIDVTMGIGYDFKFEPAGLDKVAYFHDRPAVHRDSGPARVKNVS
jgi:hypothetical protein